MRGQIGYQAYSEYESEELERAEEQLRDELEDRGWPRDGFIEDAEIEDRAKLNRQPDPDEYHDRRVDREIDADFHRRNPHYDD